MEKKKIFLYLFISFVVAIFSLHFTFLIHEIGHCMIFNKYNVSCEKIYFKIENKNKSLGYFAYAKGNETDLSKLASLDYEKMEEEHKNWDKLWDFKVFALVDFAIGISLLVLVYLILGGKV